MNSATDMGSILQSTCTMRLRQINSSPYEEGWMIKVKPSSPAELDRLMGPKEYNKCCGEEDAHH